MRPRRPSRSARPPPRSVRPCGRARRRVRPRHRADARHRASPARGWPLLERVRPAQHAQVGVGCEQCPQATHRSEIGDRVRDQHGRDARVDGDFGLPGRRHGDPPCSRVEQSLPEGRSHRGLAVWCEEHPALPRPCEDGLLVVREGALVHRQHRRHQVGEMQIRIPHLREAESRCVRRKALRPGAENGIRNL